MSKANEIRTEEEKEVELKIAKHMINLDFGGQKVKKMSEEEYDNLIIKYCEALYSKFKTFSQLCGMPLNNKKELVIKKIMSAFMKLEHEKPKTKQNFLFISAVNEKIIELIDKCDEKKLNIFIMMSTEEMLEDTKNLVKSLKEGIKNEHRIEHR